MVHESNIYKFRYICISILQSLASFALFFFYVRVHCNIIHFSTCPSFYSFLSFPSLADNGTDFEGVIHRMCLL